MHAPNLPWILEGGTGKSDKVGGKMAVYCLLKYYVLPKPSTTKIYYCAEVIFCWKTPSCRAAFSPVRKVARNLVVLLIIGIISSIVGVVRSIVAVVRSIIGVVIGVVRSIVGVIPSIVLAVAIFQIARSGVRAVDLRGLADGDHGSVL